MQRNAEQRGAFSDPDFQPERAEQLRQDYRQTDEKKDNTDRQRASKEDARDDR